MKQAQLAKLLGVSDRTLRSMGKAELGSLGWQKVGSGKGTIYRKLGSSDAESESLESLKRRKLKAEIEWREGQNENLWKAKSLEWSESFMDAFIKSFAPLKEAVRGLNLTSEQVELYNKTLDKCTTALQRESETIFMKPQ